MSNHDDPLFLLLAASLAVAAILLCAGIGLLWNASRGGEAKRIAQRLHALYQEDKERTPEVQLFKRRQLSRHPRLHEFFSRLTWMLALDRLIEQSGGRYTASRLLLGSAACAAVAYLLLPLLNIPLSAAGVLALGAAALPVALVAAKRRKRLSRIEQQLPDALDLMGRALRAGHALPGAIRMVSEELPDPIGAEFRIVFDEITYGVSLVEALRGLSGRVPGTDVGYFVVAVSIQRETGGNLTEILGNISALIRARLTLFGQVRVLSAEARFSAWILGLLPFAVAAAMHFMNPGFLSVLWTDPAGQMMLGAVALQMAFGALWMRRLVHIRV